MVTSKKVKQYQKVTASVYDECPLPREAIYHSAQQVQISLSSSDVVLREEYRTQLQSAETPTT